MEIRDTIGILNEVRAGVTPGLVPTDQQVHLVGHLLLHSTVFHNPPENFRTDSCVGSLEAIVIREIGTLYLACLESPLDVMSERGNLQCLIGVRFEPQQPVESVFSMERVFRYFGASNDGPYLLFGALYAIHDHGR